MKMICFFFLPCDSLNGTLRRYAFYFLTNQGIPEHGDHVRHFALHTLENTISMRWNKMPDEQRANYRQASMNLMVSGSEEINRWGRNIYVSVPCCSRVLIHLSSIQLRGTKSIHNEALYVKVSRIYYSILLLCLIQSTRPLTCLSVPCVVPPFFITSIFIGESCCTGSWNSSTRIPPEVEG